MNTSLKKITFKLFENFKAKCNLINNSYKGGCMLKKLFLPDKEFSIIAAECDYDIGHFIRSV